MSIHHQCLPIWPWMIWWPLIQWPLQLSFDGPCDSIHQCLPIWPWMTPDDLEVTFKIFGINTRPHPPSFKSINQCLPHLTLDDPSWPWSDLQNFQHQQLTPSTKFHVNRPMFTPFDLGWPLMTLKWPSKFSTSTIDPTHQVSCPYTNF